MRKKTPTHNPDRLMIAMDATGEEWHEVADDHGHATGWFQYAAPHKTLPADFPEVTDLATIARRFGLQQVD